MDEKTKNELLKVESEIIDVLAKSKLSLEYCIVVTAHVIVDIFKMLEEEVGKDENIQFARQKIADFIAKGD
jgi:hypothetical protein